MTDKSNPPLYPFQSECLEAVRANYVANIRRQLVALPTGTGKGHLLPHMLRMLGLWPALLLVHVEELIDQAVGHFRRILPNMTLSIEQADRRADLESDYVIASVATWSRLGKENKRLKRFPKDHFKVVISDECHLDAAPGRIGILRYFEPKLLIGMTATPYRGDAQPLSRIYDVVSYTKDLLWAIDNGYLCRLQAIKVFSQEDISNVKIRAGDFDPDDLATAINTNTRNTIICNAIEQHAQDRRAIIIYCANQLHAETLTKQLRIRGHDADFVLDYTRKDDRRDRFQRFREGKLRILVNVGCATTGTDLPIGDCCVFARPIQSPLLYTQILGRVSRLYPDKPYALIIDIVDIIGTHTIMTAAQAFGVRDFDALNTDLVESIKKIKQLADIGMSIGEDENATTIEQKALFAKRIADGTLNITTISEAVDLFAIANTIAPEVERDSIFAWCKLSNTLFAMSGSGGKTITLWEDPLGIWRFKAGDEQIELGNAPKPPFKKADKLIKRIFENWRVFSLNAKWRYVEVTEKQKETLRKFGVHPTAIPSDMTKGSASHLLDRLFLAAANRRKGGVL